MIILCGVERHCGPYGRNYGRLVSSRLFQLPYGFLCGLFLLFVVVENSRFVVPAPVHELPAVVSRVYIKPEDVEKLLVRDLVRVVYDFNGFKVIRSAVTDVMVARVFLLPAGIADRGRDNAREVVERGLHTPETAARKSSHFVLSAFLFHTSPQVKRFIYLKYSDRDKRDNKPTMNLYIDLRDKDSRYVFSGYRPGTVRGLPEPALSS